MRCAEWRLRAIGILGVALTCVGEPALADTVENWAHVDVWVEAARTGSGVQAIGTRYPASENGSTQGAGPAEMAADNGWIWSEEMGTTVAAN